MPESPTPTLRAITRRQGLAALVLIGPAGLLAACSGDSAPNPTPASTAAVEPPVADATATEEAQLIARYEAVIDAPLGLPADVAAVLAVIRDHHVAHRDALAPGADTSAPAATAVPTTINEALRSLAAAERDASRSRIRACTAAEDPELARLLAFIGASEAAHVPAIRALRA